MTGETADDRRTLGLDVYRRVYGDDATVFEAGEASFFDLMLGYLFGEVWSRPGLPLEARRLLVMGVLAAQSRFDTLRSQFARALAAGELSPEQVREVVIHLIPYVGYPASGDLFRAGEDAIAAHRGDA